MDISVIITCYNYARYLDRAIDSAIDQNFRSDGFEVIVVNDASTDETGEVMAFYDGRIRQLHLEKNVGLSASRNIGILAAKGRYVIHLDADDFFDGNILAAEMEFLEKNVELSAVSCDYAMLDEQGNRLENRNGAAYPIACGIMYLKESLLNIGLYNPQFRAMEEQELRARFEYRHRIGHLPSVLYNYRRHDKNLTNDRAMMQHYAMLLENESALCSCQR